MMARLLISDGDLLLTLTRGEKLAALHGDLRIPLNAIQSVDVVHTPFAYVRGMRTPGLALPGVILIGTWRRRGARAFVVARRNQPAVLVRLAKWGTYCELIVSDPAATETANALRATVWPPEGRFSEREITFDSEGGQLSGTLTVPDGPGPFPGALLLPGSGEVNRDSDHRRFPLGVTRELAHHLAKCGIASLRYDKRGVGQSQGDYLTAGMTENRNDVGTAWRQLADNDQIREESLFLVGHSEGALHVMQFAPGATPRPAGVVLLSGTAKTGEQTLVWQAGQIAPGLPRPVRMLLRLFRVDILRKQREAIERIRATTSDAARIQGRKVNARWLRELLDVDPTRAFRELDVPVLAVTGAKDIQVDPADLEVIAAVAPGPVETVVVPDLTHLLRRDPGAPTLSAYKKQVREPLDAEFLNLVSPWILQQAARSRPSGS
jgi:uncharacterized protein